MSPTPPTTASLHAARAAAHTHAAVAAHTRARAGTHAPTRPLPGPTGTPRTGHARTADPHPTSPAGPTPD